MSELVDRLLKVESIFIKMLTRLYGPPKSAQVKEIQEAITALSQEPGDVKVDFDKWLSIQPGPFCADDNYDDDATRLAKSAFHAAHSLYARRMAEKDARIAEFTRKEKLYREYVGIHTEEFDEDWNARRALKGESQCLAHQ